MRERTKPMLRQRTAGDERPFRGQGAGTGQTAAYMRPAENERYAGLRRRRDCGTGRVGGTMEDISDRKPHMGLFIFIVAVVSAAVVILSVNVTQVTVVGNSRYTENEIVSMLFQKNLDWNSAYFFLKEKTQEHIRIPFVEDYQVEFTGPTHVEVIVHEKSVVGYVSYMGSYMYFDKDGIVVESTDTALPGIPEISGLQFGQIVLYQALPVEDSRIFEEILNLTQLLSLRKLAVDGIRYNSKGEASLYINKVEVVLGDGSQMDGKISLLANMMPQIQDLDGTLYLDNYDENKEDLVSTFKKNFSD